MASGLTDDVWTIAELLRQAASWEKSTMRRPQFTLRDLVWLTLVVALGLGWLLADQKAEQKAQRIYGQAVRLRSTLTAAKPLVDAYCQYATTLYTASPPPTYPDFSLLDEPVIEP